MTTLHMNTDQARSTAAAMRQAAQEMQAVFNRVNSAVGALESQWQGNSASQFQAEYNAWRQRVQPSMNQLQELTARLQREIAQWEQAAAQL